VLGVPWEGLRLVEVRHTEPVAMLVHIYTTAGKTAILIGVPQCFSLGTK